MASSPDEALNDDVDVRDVESQRLTDTVTPGCEQLIWGRRRGPASERRAAARTGAGPRRARARAAPCSSRPASGQMPGARQGRRRGRAAARARDGDARGALVRAQAGDRVGRVEEGVPDPPAVSPYPAACLDEGEVLDVLGLSLVRHVGRLRVPGSLRHGTEGLLAAFR